jgi:hypothetical protein
MYVLDPALMMDEIHTFFATVADYVPSIVTLQVESTGDMIEDTTGALIGSWSETPVTPLAGAGGGIYAAPAGGCVDWLSSVVIDGRRPMGRTFLVPLVGAAFQADGTLIDSIKANIKAAGDALLVAMAGNLVVWHRPRLASAGPPAVAARAGGHVEVSACRVPDKAVVLRSRRD